MKKELELLHVQMMEELESVVRLSKDEKDMTESSFWLSNSYWDRAKDLIKKRGFKDEREEIEFFKEIKPKFTSRLEYFILLSSALSFVPKDQEKAIYYWKEEEMRCQRFSEKNGDFIGYYERGSKEMDSIYFKRVNDDLKQLLKLVSYDGDPAFCSSHDYLVRSLLAHRRYDEYVKGKIASLVASPKASNDE